MAAVILGVLLLLLLAGPAAAAWLYSAVQRRYENTDKSHDFEHETAVVARPVTGSARKIGKLTDLEKTRVEGDNVRDYRKRL